MHSRNDPPAIRILVIKTGTTVKSLLARGEDFELWFRDGMELKQSQVAVCNVYLDEPLPDLGTIDGIVITGSPAFLTDLAPWNFVAADYLRQAHKYGMPILGICYGHQLLAWAFGGRVDFNPRGREIGSVDIDLSEAAETDTLFSGYPSEFCVQVSHLQSVIELPESATLLASNDYDHNHGFRLGERTWCLQFHPEFTAEITRAYIRERATEIAAEGLDPQALLTRVQETETAASLLQRFVSIVEQNSRSA